MPGVAQPGSSHQHAKAPHRSVAHGSSSRELRSLEWVPAVFGDWGEFDKELRRHRDPPVWADALLPHRVEYQRLNPSLSNFVPNRMNEGGVFLHHVAHRYHHLADVTLFSQSDITEHEARSAACLSPAVDWAPLPGKHFFMPGKCGWWDNPKNNGSLYKAAVQQCFANIAALFDVALPSSSFACPHFYAQNKFYVSRRVLHRVPLSVWRAAYQEHVVDGTCHSDGLINRSFVERDAWRRHVERANLSAADLQHPVGNPAMHLRVHNKKHVGMTAYNQEMSAAWEFMSNSVFGGQPFISAAWGQARWCAAFRVQGDGECRASPCRARAKAEAVLD
jgi:hypothetical protein